MKLFKLFLVVAIATLGLSLTANAKSLSEAIEGVDVSGSFTYKASKRTHDDAKFTAGGVHDESTQTIRDEGFHDIDFDVTVKIPTSEKTSFVFAVEDVGDEDFNSKTNTSGDFTNSGDSLEKDSSAVGVQMNTIYFKKQANEKTALYYGMFDQHEGLKVSHDLGIMNVGAHYWFNTEDGVNDEMALALSKIKAGPATVNFKYQVSTDVDTKAAQNSAMDSVTTLETEKDEGWTKINVGVSVPVGPLAINVKHYAKTLATAITDHNATTDPDTGSETMLKVGYKANGVYAHFIYLMIGDLGGITDGDMGIDTDNTYDNGHDGKLAGGSAMELKVAYNLPAGTPSLTYTVKAIGDDYSDANTDATDDADVKLAFKHSHGSFTNTLYYATSTGFAESSKHSETGIVLAYKF